MQKDSKNVVRHVAAYLLARGVPGLISFLAIPLYTHLLDPGKYGKYALAVSTVALINALAFQWMRLSFVRYLPAAKENKDALKSTLLTCQLILVLIGGLVALTPFLVPRLQEWRGIAVICWMMVAVQPLFELFCEQARALIQPRYYMGLMLSRAVLSTGIGALLIVAGLGWWGPLLGMAIGNLIPGLYAYRHDWRGVRLGIDRQVLATVCRYGIPLSLTVALAIVISSSDRYLIAWFLGSGAAGVYSAAVDLTMQTLTLVMMSISLAIMPLAIRAWENHGPEAAREQMRHNATLLLSIGIPAVIGLMVLAPNISGCFLGAGFRKASAQIIPIIALGTFMAGYKAYHLDSAFQFVHRTIYQVWIVAIAAIVNIVLNLLLIRPFGIIGAAGASVIAYAVSMLLTAGFGRRHFALPFPMRGFLQVAAAGGVMALLLWLVRDHRGAAALAIQVALGAAIYGAVLVSLNFLGLRATLRERLFARRPVVSGTAAAAAVN